MALLQSRAGVASSPFADPGIIRSIYNGGNVLSRILAMVVGIVTVGSEYRYGTIASSYLATPHRVRMLLGKAIALLIFGVIYGITSVAAGMLVSIPFVLGNGGTFLLDQPETWRSIILGRVLDRAVDLDRHGHRDLDQEHAGRPGGRHPPRVPGGADCVGGVLPEEVGPTAQSDAQRGDERHAGDHLARAVRWSPSSALVARRAGPCGLVPAAGARRPAIRSHAATLLNRVSLRRISNLKGSAAQIEPALHTFPKGGGCYPRDFALESGSGGGAGLDSAAWLEWLST